MLFKKAIPSIRITKTECLITVKLCIKGIRVARMQCVAESDSTIMIGDIIHDNTRKYNKGYGSMMMKTLISYAKENGYTYIYGNLSDVDLGHKERLHHFYEKFGFKITEYAKKQNCYYGKIELRLL